MTESPDYEKDKKPLPPPQLLPKDSDDWRTSYLRHVRKWAGIRNVINFGQNESFLAGQLQAQNEAVQEALRILSKPEEEDVAATEWALDRLDLNDDESLILNNEPILSDETKVGLQGALLLMNGKEYFIALEKRNEIELKKEECLDNLDMIGMNLEHPEDIEEEQISSLVILPMLNALLSGERINEKSFDQMWEDIKPIADQIGQTKVHMHNEFHRSFKIMFDHGYVREASF